MIKDVISSAARLPLAPARLTGRISGSLLRQLRGNDQSEAQPRSSAGGNRSSGTRTKAQSKRTKAQSKRGKAQPRRTKAQPKRAATRTRAKAQPKRAPRPKPLDDAAIAQKVESTVFSDLDVDRNEVTLSVDEGVVSLGGEVSTPDLIKELEARAAQVTEVRRVENKLRLPEAAPSEATATPGPQPTTGRFERHRPEDHATVPSESGDAAESGPLRPAGGESAEQDGPDVAELDQDPAYQPGDPSLRGLKGG